MNTQTSIEELRKTRHSRALWKYEELWKKENPTTGFIWDKIKTYAEKQEAEPRENYLDGDSYYKCVLLGSTLNIMPSGKIYAPWTTNQTERDSLRDEIFSEMLDSEAEEAGGFIEWRDDDCFFVMEVDPPDEDEIEPDRDDFYITPSGELGSLLSVSIEGKHVGQFKSDDEVISFIKQWMEENNFYPNVWFIDDHGGTNPYSLGE